MARSDDNVAEGVYALPQQRNNFTGTVIGSSETTTARDGSDDIQNFPTHNHTPAGARLVLHRDRGQGRVGGSRVSEWVLPSWLCPRVGL